MMNFWDNIKDTSSDQDNLWARNSYGQEDTLRAAPEKSWGRSIAETAGFPKTAAWMAGEYTGRPQSAPGALYDILPEIGNYIEAIPGAVKGLANIPIQAARRSAMAKEIPQMGQLFQELGNPLTNAWKMIKGVVPDVSIGGEQVAMAAADNTLKRPETYGSGILGSMVDRLKGSWNMDIPYNAVGTKYPWSVVTKDQSGEMLPKIADTFGAGGAVSEKTRGFYVPLSAAGDKGRHYLGDLIALQESAIPAGTPLHETGHLFSKRAQGYGDNWLNVPTDYVSELRGQLRPDIPAQASTDLNRFFGRFATDNPVEVSTLRDKYGYRGLSDSKLGEEAWTRMNAGQAPFQDTIPEIPMPKFERRMQSATDDLLHPYFKNYGNQGSATPAGALNAIAPNFWDSASWR